MAPVTYREYVENFLRTVAQRGDGAFRFDDLVDQIISDKRAQGALVATNHRFIIWHSLLSEAENQRVVVEGEGTGATASFTSSGLAHFQRAGERRVESNNGVELASGGVGLANEGVEQVNGGAEQAGTKGRTKRELQNEYSRLANIVAQVVHALEGFEPPAMLLDASNLPHLVRSNIVTMNYMEDINEDILQQIRETGDRLGFALGW